MALTETKAILLLSDDALEELMKKWIAQERTQYVDFERNSGSGDRGIDAVGFLTKQRYEGDWHNYQCKQLNRALGEPAFFAELGKVIYYSCQGEFTMPKRYIFVAPKGVTRYVRKYLFDAKFLEDRAAGQLGDTLR